MLGWLNKLLVRSPSTPLTKGPDVASTTPGVPVYPPVDVGIPLISVEEVVASQRDIEERIFRSLGLAHGDFTRLVHPVIENLAGFVHLLPATSHEHHSGAGGLFRLCMELSLHSLHGANTAVFPVAGGIERRYLLQPRWTMATWLAGLCCQINRVASDMLVVSNNDQQWQPLLVPLHGWLKSIGATSYFVRWLPDRSGATSNAFLVKQVITDEMLGYLAENNQDVVPGLTAFLTKADQSNAIAKIVNPMAAKLIEEDRKRSPSNYGKMTAGSHLEPHLIGAMRRLLEEGTWLVNGQRAVVFIGTDGVFLDWAIAQPAILERLKQDGVQGIPSDMDTLMDLMVNAGIFERAPQGKRYLQLEVSARGRVGAAVRFVVPNLIFPSDVDPAEFAEQALLYREPAAAEKPVAAPPAKKAEKPAAEPKPKQQKARKEPPAPPPDRNEPPPMDDIPPPTDDFRPDTGGDFSEMTPYDDVPPGAPGPAEEPPPNMGSSEAPPSAALPAADEQAHEPGGKLDDVPPPAAEMSADAEEALGLLRKDAAWLLREIINNHRAGKLTGRIVSLSQGIGISHEELGAHGQQVPPFIDELARKEFLWLDPTKPRRNIHVVDVAGDSLRVIVLKKSMAERLGLYAKT